MTAETIAYEELERRESIYDRLTIKITNDYPYIQAGDIVSIVDGIQEITKTLEIVDKDWRFAGELKSTLSLLTALTPRYILESETVSFSDSISHSDRPQYFYGKADGILVINQLTHDDTKEYTF